MATTISITQLVGLQRAEFAKAARLQHRILQIQCAIAALAAISVFFEAPMVSYGVAVVALGFAGVWALIGWQYRASRGQAERARRATLLMQGLDETISDGELRKLKLDFTVTTDQGRVYEDANYYAAQAAPGSPRLVEMLEETCFWSCHLLKGSARRSWFAFIAFVAIGLLLFLISILVFDGDRVQSAARLFCVLLTFVVSTEVVGAALAYDGASQALSTILPRIEAVRASGNRTVDLLMILSDYNSAVEGAPMFWPGLYEKERDRLNQLWSERTS